MHTSYIRDAILDTGANGTYFNSEYDLENIRKISGELYVANNNTVSTSAVGEYGVLKHVTVAKNLRMCLISGNDLTISNDFLIFIEKK